MRLNLVPCKKCGGQAIYDAATNSVRCENGCFKISTKVGKDPHPIWNSVQNKVRKQKHRQQVARMAKDSRELGKLIAEAYASEFEEDVFSMFLEKSNNNAIIITKATYVL